jgi:hypothetical protein
MQQKLNYGICLVVQQHEKSLYRSLHFNILYLWCVTDDGDGDARGAHGSRKRRSRWWRNNADRGAMAMKWWMRIWEDRWEVAARPIKSMAALQSTPLFFSGSALLAFVFILFFVKKMYNLYKILQRRHVHSLNVVIELTEIAYWCSMIDYMHRQVKVTRIWFSKLRNINVLNLTLLWYVHSTACFSLNTL